MQLTLETVLEAINNYQHIQSDVKFDIGQLIDVNSELSSNHDIGKEYEVLIAANSKGLSDEEEKREFSLNVKDGKIIDFRLIKYIYQL